MNIVANAVEKRASRKKKKPPKAGIVGPLFRWELVRLARRGQDARARFILCLALFLFLTAFTLIWFNDVSPVYLFFGSSQSLTINEVGLFGQSFTLTFLLAQLAILVLLTPAYSAGGIAEEKERKTFPFLLSSDLTAREIVFGKFLGRLVFLLGLLASGLPILAITQIHGGVSSNFLIFAYIITAATVILLAAIGAACASAADTLRGALFRAYGLALIISVAGAGLSHFLSPFAVISILFIIEERSPGWFWGLGITYPIVELIGAIIAVVIATVNIRNLRAKLTSERILPPRKVRERYQREDRQKARQDQDAFLKQLEATEEKNRRDLATATTGQLEGSLELKMDPGHAEQLPLAMDVADPASSDGSVPVVVAASSIPIAPVSKPPEILVAAAIPSEIQLEVKQFRRNEPRPNSVYTRPPIRNLDPFIWKERYSKSMTLTADDEAIRAMMYLLGGTLALIVVFFFTISILTLVLSEGSTKGIEASKWLLIISGATGMFIHLLLMCMTSTSSVGRERQQSTLESLLTLPVERKSILQPKWIESIRRGWWWGGPALFVLVLSGFTTPAPQIGLFLIPMLLLSPLFIASLGLWLSIRCVAVSRALLWSLPALILLVLFPVFANGWVDQSSWWIWSGIAGMFSVGLGLGSYVFWKLAVRDFSKDTVLIRE